MCDFENGGMAVELAEINGRPCQCGKPHVFPVERIISGKGAINRLPEYIAEYGARNCFVIADGNTYRAAGDAVCALIKKAGAAATLCLLPGERPEPDETAVGYAAMRFDRDCDLIIGIGSGVVNDTGKIISSITRLPYIIVATAPSMDGFASLTSSMVLGGLKVSLPSRAADVIIGDTEILASAPDRMLMAGMGDMLAKYVSICEWRISNIVTGEYYCERVAALVRSALKRCVDNAGGLMRRDPSAVEAVFSGLAVCGVAMNYAGLSRPASGVEHYFSHIWDMRALEFGAPSDLHGIQCGVATVEAIKLYEQFSEMVPDKSKALDCAENFDYADWSRTLEKFVGRAAGSMIENERKERKYDLSGHAARLERILSRHGEILNVIKEELPPAGGVEKLLRGIGAPASPEEIGIGADVLPLTFKAAKDIRAKYVLPMLAWDLGVLDDFTF